MTLNDQWKNELRNLKARIRTAKKAGFVFSDETIAKLTQKPKQVRQASIDKLKHLRGDTLRLKADVYASQLTGEALKPKQGIKEQKELSQEKAKETRQRKKENEKVIDSSELIIENFLNSLEDIPQRGKREVINKKIKKLNQIKEKCKEIMENYGTEYLADILQRNASDLSTLIDYFMITYDGNEITSVAGRILFILSDGNLTFEENAAANDEDDEEFFDY